MAPHSWIIRVYNMPTQKKKLEFKQGRLPSKLRDRLADFVRKLYGEEFIDLIPVNLKYVCFERDLCLIYEKPLRGLDNLTVLFNAPWIAIYVNKHVLPSIPLVARIYREKGVRAAIVVKEQGVKAFLYGNDILVESVLKKIPPDKGVYTVIDGEDGEILGFVEWSEKKKVYVNLYDIGLFLRKLG